MFVKILKHKGGENNKSFRDLLSGVFNNELSNFVIKSRAFQVMFFSLKAQWRLNFRGFFVHIFCHRVNEYYP